MVPRLGCTYEAAWRSFARALKKRGLEKSQRLGMSHSSCSPMHPSSLRALLGLAVSEEFWLVQEGTNSAISFSLDMGDLESLGYPSRSTIIFEAELTALLVCFKVWKQHLHNRPYVMYIDNNATRDVSISGRARASPASSLVAELLILEDRN